MIPLRSLARIEYTSGPGTMTRFNNLPAVQVLGGGKPGVSSGDAIAEVERIAREVLPPDFSLDWSGASYQEKKSGGTSVLVLALGALMVFLILAAQYEKWSLPLSVLLALPFGTFGALAAVWLRGLTNDVYFQIGLVTLLGLAAKNAILIVEYAVLKHEEGLSASAAAVEAARLRFRPILMTSLAFILGVLPLAFSSGAGAGARISAGTGVMGGMLAATFLAIFFVPTFFKLLTDRHLTEKRSSAEIKREAETARNVSPPRRCPRRTTRRTGRGTNEAALPPRWRWGWRAASTSRNTTGRRSSCPRRGSRPRRASPRTGAGGASTRTRSWRRWSTRRSRATPTC